MYKVLKRLGDRDRGGIRTWGVGIWGGLILVGVPQKEAVALGNALEVLPGKYWRIGELNGSPVFRQDALMQVRK